MNTLNLRKGLLYLPALAMLLCSSCSKTEDTMDDEAACENYLAGLSYQCTEDNCVYNATLEHYNTGVKTEITINKVTYDHYKAITEQQAENICWEGEVQ